MMNLFKPKPKQHELRDIIAISVLPEVVHDSCHMKRSYAGCENILDDNCRTAYMIADAMLKARKRTKK